MIDWYLKVVRDNHANFNGRARRSEYWYFALCNGIIGLILRGVDHLVDPDMEIIGTLYSLAVFLPGLAVMVRRLHDIGKSGWYVLYFLIPVFAASIWLVIAAVSMTGFAALSIVPVLILIGSVIWMIVLMCTDGETGPNEYGGNPKNPDNMIDEIGTTESY